MGDEPVEEQEPAADELLELVGVTTAEEQSLLNQYFRDSCATIIQRHARRYNQRVRIIELYNSIYEKILDPKRRCYYYYNIEKDRSSWTKPRLLHDSDIWKISPSYTIDEAATMIQRQARRRKDLKRIRRLYKMFVKEMLDKTGTNYYFNPLTSRTMWELPSFMGGKLNHVYHDNTLIKKEVTEEEKEDEEEEEEESSDESNLSEDSELVRQRRREARIFPRSKVQSLVDTNEDNQELTSLDLTGIGATRFTSRLYDLTSLTSLNLSHNNLLVISRNIQYLDNLEEFDMSYNQLSTLPREIEELSELRIVNLSHNDLVDLPGKHLSSIQPPFIRYSPHLFTHLTFPSLSLCLSYSACLFVPYTHCMISGHFYKLENLEELDLSHNPLKTLPIEVGNLELLKETQKWEVGIGLLKSLRKLNIQGRDSLLSPTYLNTLSL